MINLQESDEQFLSGGGQMGALIRSKDWSSTPLGPVGQWPQSLRTSVSLCLSSTFPILIAWGPELIQIYNDSYRPICGAKHPESLGQNFKICWETALPVVGAAFDRGLAGEGTYIKDQQMLLDRYGYIEEAFMTFSFAPIRDESGEVGGIFHPITETTEQILSSRRTQVLRDLAFETADLKTNEEIYRELAEVQPRFWYDVPFLQVYEIDYKTGSALLKTSAGISTGVMDFPEIPLDSLAPSHWPFHEVAANSPVPVTDLTGRFGAFHSGPFEQAPHTALIFPIQIAGNDKPTGYLVLGVSSARGLDQAYQNFFELLANTVSSVFSNVDAYQQQQKRAQQLAEIDRAKTAFFSNVSHEFRTPLTLILGPLQQIVDGPDDEAKISRHDGESMYRNAQRLLKLVNNLLDFSRLEAGRVKASYQQTRLGALTADLSSNFRSVIESAGMELQIEVRDEAEAYVDTDMWEKIVLNLLSNAFKYTLKGTITVQIGSENGHAVLDVRDTGVGIEAKELPHMFERFHRIENSSGRTHEGTGIGLSLVSELVSLHHGQISVSSVFGEGSTFTVKIPLGKNHLPKEKLVAGGTKSGVSSQQQTFIREAMSLLDHQEHTDETGGPTEPSFPQDDQTFPVQKDMTVLIVDDNADMRAYLGKLLSPYFSVEFAVNGQDALEKIADTAPDVVVSDVMMPVMDGQQMLRQLRLKTGPRVPVILLSARAGEESRIEGLGWGADDYLVKPFSAKELLSKVTSLIQINNVTRKTETELRNIFLSAPVAIGIFRGADLVIEVANKMMLRYWGQTSGQVIGLPFAEAFETAPDDGLAEIARNVFHSGERRTLRDWPLHVTRNGKTTKLYVNLALEPLHDITGVVNGVMVVANDVTELITALELVRESEQRFKILANAMPQHIWRIDRTGGTNFYNEFVFSYSGLSREALLSQGLIQLVHPDERADNLAAWENALQTGRDFSYEHRFRRGDGEYRWHLSRAIAQRGPNGEIESWIGASTDIHDQKTLEETLESRVRTRTAALKSINEQLMRNNRELEQFAHVTSHDLQEPLRKIQVFSGLVYENMPEANEMVRNYLKRIIASSERMSLLIKDLLTFTRVADAELVFELVDLNQVMAQVIGDYDHLIEEKQAQISIDALPVIDAVPLQMNQLFYNLLGNALKFSDTRSVIEIQCRAIDPGDSSHYPFLRPATAYTAISFKDHGIGFDQEFAERIFTIFQRLHTQTEFPGTGIGLSICKRVVENHRGHIEVQSQKGVGSVFEVYLPVRHGG